MQTFTITFNAGWSNRKIPQMERDLLMMVRREGAKNVRFHREGAPPPDEKPILNLACSECEKSSNGKPAGFWTARFFSECPTCGRRDNVRKLNEQEVEERDTALAEAAAEAAAKKAAVPVRRTKTGRKHRTHHWKKDRTCRECGRKKPGRAAVNA